MPTLSPLALPNSDIANAAMEFTASRVPEPVHHHHCVRSPVGGFAAAGTERPEDLAAEFTRYLARRDVDGLMALYDADAVFVPEPGVVAHGHEQIRAALAAMADAGVTFELDLESIHVTGDQALIADKATVRASDSEDGSTIVTTEVARRRAGGRWVYLMDDLFFAQPPALAGTPLEHGR